MSREPTKGKVMRDWGDSYIEFRDIFLEAIYYGLSRNSINRTIVVHSKDAAIIKYGDFLNTCPLDAFTFPLPYLNTNCLLGFDYIYTKNLTKEEFGLLKESIMNALEYYLKQEIDSTINIKSTSVEIIPFDENYFLDSDKIIFGVFEVEMNEKNIPFTLIFLAKQFKCGFYNKTSLAS